MGYVEIEEHEKGSFENEAFEIVQELALEELEISLTLAL